MHSRLASRVAGPHASCGATCTCTVCTCAAYEGRLLQYQATKCAQAARQHELQGPQRLQRRDRLLRLVVRLQLEAEQVLAHRHRLLLCLRSASTCRRGSAVPQATLLQGSAHASETHAAGCWNSCRTWERCSCWDFAAPPPLMLLQAGTAAVDAAWMPPEAATCAPFCPSCQTWHRQRRRQRRGSPAPPSP
jgi:hypothetical protein